MGKGCLRFGEVFLHRRPGGHGVGGGGAEVFWGGTVAGLDGHALVEGDVEAGERFDVGLWGEVAFVDAALEAGLEKFDDVLACAADFFSEIGQVFAGDGGKDDHAAGGFAGGGEDFGGPMEKGFHGEACCWGAFEEIVDL